MQAVEILDQEYGTKVTISNGSSFDKLAYLVRYMWKVFGYAFYSGVRCEDERSVALKCFRYERSTVCDETRTPEASQFESTYVAFAESLI